MIEKQKAGTSRIGVFLPEDQIAWLKGKPKGISSTIRALILEAMNLENLAKSVKKKGKKATSVPLPAGRGSTRKRRGEGP